MLDIYESKNHQDFAKSLGSASTGTKTSFIHRIASELLHKAAGSTDRALETIEKFYKLQLKIQKVSGEHQFAAVVF